MRAYTVAGLGLLAVLSAGTVHAQSIQEMFRMAPCQNGEDGLTPHPDEPVVVDERNAYLLVGDTSDTALVGAGQHVFTAFARRDGKRLYACTEFEWGDDENYHRLSFYELVDGTLRPVEYPVIPRLDLEDFWAEGTLPPAKKYRLVNLRYTLPRVGTTIRVEPWPIYDLPGAVHDSLDPSDVVSGADLDEYVRTVESRRYRAIELNWDAERGVFRIGRKIPR